MIKRIFFLLVVLFLSSPVHSDQLTFYAGAGDGRVSYSNTSWSTCRGAATGDSVDYTSSTILSGYVKVTAYPTYTIRRIFLPFDTSAIPDDATIDSATLYVYFQDPNADDNDSQAYVTIVQATQASSTSLTTADFDAVGSTAGTDAPVNINTLTDYAFQGFALNTTGLGWISKTGYTKFALREGHDFENSALTYQGFDTYNWHAADPSEGTNDAYLVVNYTPAAGSFTEDGFETGDYSKWTSTNTTGTGSTLAVNGTTVYEGIYSSKSFTTNDEAYSYLNVTIDEQTLSDVYIRWYMYINTLTLASGSNLYFFYMYDDNSADMFNLQIDDVDEKLEILNDVTSGSDIDADFYSFGEWVCLEAHVNVHDTTGDIDLWKNGSLVANFADVDTKPGATSYVGGFQIGVTYADDIADDVSVYIDDVILSTSQIGCDESTSFHRGAMVIE